MNTKHGGKRINSGRPPLKPRERRSVVYSLRLTEVEARVIKKRSREWAIETLLKAANKP